MAYIDDLRAERVSRGLSQQAVAAAMGTTQSAVSRAERGGNPRQDFLQRYRDALRGIGTDKANGADEADVSPLELTTVRMVVADVARRYGMGAMYLYGSVARGEARPDSDIDLMYRYDRDRPGRLPDVMAMKRDLERALGREVSLLSLDSLERHALTSPASRRFHDAAARDMVRVA